MRECTRSLVLFVLLAGSALAAGVGGTSSQDVAQAGSTNLKAVRTSASIVQITADDATLRNSDSNLVRVATWSVSPDKTTAGPAANGRDQAGAFSNSSFVYGYLIWNPASGTKAGLWSVSATTPTLPSGYTFYQMATIARIDGSGNFLDYVQAGKNVAYVSTFHTLLSAGDSATYVAISATGFIPPGVRIGKFYVTYTNTTNVAREMYLSADGVIEGFRTANASLNLHLYYQVESPVNSSQQIYYKVSETTGSQAYIYVRGFRFD